VCPTFIHRWQDVIPASGKKVKYEDVREAVVLVSKEADGKIKGQKKWLVRTCGADERWTGLWDFPRYRMPADTLPSQLKQQTGFSATLVPFGKSIKHAVTRYRIELHCFEATDLSGRLKKQATETTWATIEQLEELPMSVTGRKIVDRLKE